MEAEGKSATFASTSKWGLSSTEAAIRLQRFGPNKLPEKSTSTLSKILMEFVQPMPLIIWFAIFVEVVEFLADGNYSSIMDAAVLLALQMLNVVIGFREELKAGDEIRALKDSLKPEAVVIRNGQAVKINAEEVVPGDRVLLSAGCAVPADCVLATGGSSLQVDQSAITGESLPVSMKPMSMIKMSSVVTRGESEAIVVATGKDTTFGQTAMLINSVEKQPHFEVVLRQLMAFLVGLGIAVCYVIFCYMRSKHVPLLQILGFNVVLLIASIPVALRVVCTCTLALGCKELAAEKAIVSRLSAVEELASIDVLCSDKTGTLTLNKMVLQEDMMCFVEPRKTRSEVLTLAALATKWFEPPKDALDTLILDAVNSELLTTSGYLQTNYVPFDPCRKRTEATVTSPEGKTIRTIKGAPDVVLDLCDGNKEIVQTDVERHVSGLASRGVRSLAVACSEDNGPMYFVSLLTFLDPPRPDARQTLLKAAELGVSVKMLTGDHYAIAVEMSRTLGLGDRIKASKSLPVLSIEEMTDGKEVTRNLGRCYGQMLEDTDGFAQVMPEHKYLIVESLRQRGHVVCMTGDGVNDAPALKRADVGIAVCDATQAAQAASDIVLTQPGLRTVVLAIYTSRKIFQRMKNFVIYRVACTQQLLLFFFISCLCVDPKQVNPSYGATYFSIPVIALVSITILNDGTIVSVAYDNVQASRLCQPKTATMCRQVVIQKDGASQCSLPSPPPLV
eukprot:TRINITY_DN27371_c0_g1_i1.p1 TRINITY_DN27371_c0_g1~~TRINITY_DN27371_c0_g1_i1.p1  ORF type:complete len:778 (-),score=122.08 TRINITY_DN27371_c0_g1_i1:48-2243(-)